MVDHIQIYDTVQINIDYQRTRRKDYSIMTLAQKYISAQIRNNTRLTKIITTLLYKKDV